MNRAQRLFAVEPSSLAVEQVQATEDAHTLTCSFWERTNPKPATKFIALRTLVQRFLDAGWSPHAINRALSETRAFTLAGLEFTLRGQAEQQKLRRPKSLDLLQRRMAEHQAAER